MPVFSEMRFRKNEPVRNIFLTVFVTMVGLVLAHVLNPATSQQVVGIITGWGDETISPLHLPFVGDTFYLVEWAMRGNNPNWGSVCHTPLRKTP